MWSDFRYALRALRHAKAFAAVSIVLLALGIGANTAIFSLAEALILRPLPVPDPSGLLNLTTFSRGAKLAGVSFSDPLSYPEYRDYRDRAASFAGLTAYRYSTFGYSAQRGVLPQARFGILVSGNFFSVLGVPMRLGRDFEPREDQVPGRDAVAVISHNFWTKELGGRSDIVGSTIYLGGLPFTVIGVAAESFTSVDLFTRPCFFVPLMMAPALTGKTPAEVLEDRAAGSLSVKGRLSPGVTLRVAATEAAAIAAQLQQDHRGVNRTRNATVETEVQLRMRQSAADMILAGFMVALSGIVLLIACANVANLMLSRTRARAREIAIRLAIGAGRAAIVRQSLAESVLLAIAGGLLGLALAQAAADAFSQLKIPSDIPVTLAVTLDPQVLLYTLLATFASALLFGFAPAWTSTRTDLVPALKASDAGDGTRTRLFGRNTLVVAQVAGSLLLLVVATQFYLGSRALLQADPLYRVDHLLTAGFDPGLARYTPEQTINFYRRLLEKARALPGVREAALTNSIPTAPTVEPRNVVPDGYALPPGTEAASVIASIVTPGYFETIGVPLLQGRGFLPTDRSSAPLVAVVNERFARRFYPGAGPIGKRFRLNNGEGQFVEVVGVARQSKYMFIAEPPVEAIYLPLEQYPRSNMTLLLHTAGHPGALAAPLRDAVRSLDSAQPMFNVRTMQEFFDLRSRQMLGFISSIFGTMALLGLLLALTGLYGLMSYLVSRRTREIGIRMAIGAGQSLVRRAILTRAGTLAALGIAIGLVLSLALSQTLTRTLGIPGFNLGLVALAAAGLLFVSLFGAYGPARRASNIDPASVMRQD